MEVVAQRYSRVLKRASVRDMLTLSGHCTVIAYQKEPSLLQRLPPARIAKSSSVAAWEAPVSERAYLGPVSCQFMPGFEAAYSLGM